MSADYVRVRDTAGRESVVTAKVYSNILRDRGFRLLGRSDPPAEPTPEELEEAEEVGPELLRRRSFLRGKSVATIVKRAGDDAEEARLLWEAEIGAQNRPEVLEALDAIVQGAPA